MFKKSMLRQKLYLVFVCCLVLSLTLVGCGSRDQETVLKDLGEMKQDLKAYESKAMMTVSANNQVQKYSIETWYQSPHYYRIALGNENKEVTQVIIRNDDGVFVVSPQLKKSFRFRGDWAENQGYVYLYHAVIDRVLNAKERGFEAKDGQLSFTMKMEPENPLVTEQKVTLKDSNLHPVQVALLDKDKKAVVSVDYESFKSGVEFKKEQFSPEAAMAMAPTDAKPVMAGAKDFGIIEPRYLPNGAKMVDQQETKSTVMLRFDGQNPFTITEHRPAAKDTSLYAGEIVDLWGVPAVVAGAEAGNRSMYWFHNGVEFSLTGNMAVDEMIRVAQSMTNHAGK